MVRLLIDDSAGFSQGAGIGRYARNVVPAALDNLPDWAVTLLYASAHRKPEPFQDAALAAIAPRDQLQVRRVPVPRQRLDLLWFRLRLPVPADLIAGRSDIVYSPDFTTPPTIGKKPHIVTVHDLAFLVAPEFAPPGLRRFLSGVVRAQVATAQTVAVVSETTRIDVIERLNVDPARVVVIGNGVDERFFRAESPTTEFRQRLGLPESYLLIVGTLEPRKNHLTLFRAVERHAADIGLPLVVAGRRGWADEAIVAEMKRLESRGLVIPLDFVSDDDLPSLYVGSACVVYPSWYEGFGLPVLEAMAAGVPVVTSTAPALVEVGGDAVLSAAADSADDIADAIQTALRSDSRTDDAKALRVMRARSYAWGESGTRLAAALRTAVEVGQ